MSNKIMKISRIDIRRDTRFYESTVKNVFIQRTGAEQVKDGDLIWHVPEMFQDVVLAFGRS